MPQEWGLTPQLPRPPTLRWQTSEVSLIVSQSSLQGLALSAPRHNNLHNAPCTGLHPFPSPLCCFLGQPPAPISCAPQFLSQGLLLGTPKLKTPCLGTKQITAYSSYSQAQLQRDGSAAKQGLDLLCLGPCARYMPAPGRRPEMEQNELKIPHSLSSHWPHGTLVFVLRSPLSSWEIRQFMQIHTKKRYLVPEAFPRCLDKGHEPS